MRQHTGNTITDLQDMIERYAAKKAVDEMGETESLAVVTERAKKLAAEVAKDPRAGDWFRFLNEDQSDEPDYDRDAEDMCN